MAITKQQRTIWSPTSPATLAAGGTLTSTEIAIGQDAIGVDVEVQASGAGTGTVDVYMLSSTGDFSNPADGVLDHSTVNHGTFLGRIDLSADNPARLTVSLSSTAMQAWKLHLVNNDTVNSVTVSAIASEQNAA